MKLGFLLLATTLFCFTDVWAQTNYEDVVYLKDGSIIHGMIIEQVPNVSIKIKSGPNVFVYKIADIEKFTKEEVEGSSDVSKDFDFRQKGYSGIVELGLSDYPKGGNVAMFAIIIVNGYRFNPYFSMGLGVGAEISTKSIYNLPVFADMRAYFVKARVSPFFNIGAGYNAQIVKTDSYYDSGSSVSHGFLINPATGICVSITEKLIATFSVGYKLIGSWSGTDYYYYYSDRNFEPNHAVIVRFGIGL